MKKKMAGKIQKGIVLLFTLCLSTLFSGMILFPGISGMSLFHGMSFFHEMPLFHGIPVHAAQEPEFRLDTDTLNLQKGVSCNIVVSLINAQGAEITGIDGLEDFDVLSQTQSSSTSIVNNVTTKQVDLYVTIMPKVTGQFTLKANISYAGQDYETNTLEVTVTESGDGESQSTPDLFVETTVSHEEAYLGEKLVVTYTLYSRESVDGYGFTNYTAIDGMIAKDTPTDQLKTEYVYIEGNRYIMYEVKQLIIDPMKTGTFTIPSFNLQVNVLTDSGMGGFFGGLLQSTTPKYLQTEEKELIVKPLPEEGKPDNFSGIVGELTLNSNYSRNEVNYGDSLALQIDISGSCNLDGITNITGNGITGFTVYETLKNTVESVESGQYHIQKTYEEIFVPEETGVLEVPPISISYFNPSSGKYEMAEIPAATINVLGDKPLMNTNDANQGSSIETVNINQVNYAEEPEGYYSIQIRKDLVYTILTGIIILIIIVFILLWMITIRKKRNPVLKSLYRQLMDAKDINEIYTLFNDMIKYCYNVNLKACSRNVIRIGLPDVELTAQVMDIIDYMESDEHHDEKGLKNKIKVVYNSKLR